ncbi:MAG: lipopolysaccharide heptosyltransferase I [Acidobacteriota bacterium]|nr:lipopolysaccharide heptosyltransferase I [Acidobacteriota bacterium]
MNVLIVKLGSIGDIVHTLPALAAIRRALPEAEISWVVEKRAAEILRANPFLTNLIEIDTRALRGRKTSISEKYEQAREQLERLRTGKYDIALDFQGLHKSALIAKLSGAARRVGFDKAVLREPTSRFLLTETVKIPAKTHIIRKNLLLAEPALQIEVPVDSSELEFPIGTEEQHEREALEIIEKTGADFAILNPGGGWATKLWNAGRFGRLADEIWKNFNLKSIVTYGPGEKNLAETVVAASKSNQAVAADLSLKGFYQLARRAKVYVGGDTGPTHLAIAARAPVVGLFGPTEWWRNGSPFEGDICVERTEISCRTNCHRRSCSNWICLDIEVETVLRAVKNRLKLETIRF